VAFGATVVIAAGVWAATAAAHDFDAHPAVTASASPSGVVRPAARVLVFGKVTSKERSCIQDQTVTLYEKRRTGIVELATDTTDAEGEYKIVFRPKRSKLYFVRFAGSSESSYGHSHLCHSDNSPKFKVMVSGR
jgi:hypothetical protein